MYPFFEDNSGPRVAGVPRKEEADHRRQKVLPEPEDEFQTKGETTHAQHSARPSQQDGLEGNRRRGFPPWEEREMRMILLCVRGSVLLHLLSLLDMMIIGGIAFIVIIINDIVIMFSIIIIIMSIVIAIIAIAVIIFVIVINVITIISFSLVSS